MRRSRCFGVYPSQKPPDPILSQLMGEVLGWVKFIPPWIALVQHLEEGPLVLLLSNKGPNF